MRSMVTAVSRACDRRIGDCLGMLLAGGVFFAAPADAEATPVIAVLGACMAAVGLAAAAAALMGRRDR